MQRRRFQFGGRRRVPPMPIGRKVHGWLPSGGTARLVVRASTDCVPTVHSSVDVSVTGARQTPPPSCSRARCTRRASPVPTPETMHAQSGAFCICYATQVRPRKLRYALQLRWPGLRNLQSRLLPLGCVFASALRFPANVLTIVSR